MSGGVDFSVAAPFGSSRAYDVVCVFMKNLEEKDAERRLYCYGGL